MQGEVKGPRDDKSVIRSLSYQKTQLCIANCSHHEGQARARILAETLQEEVVQQIRIGRIAAAQDKELWIRNMKMYLRGE